MNQNEIRPYNGRQYDRREGAEIIEELDRRTKTDESDFNSLSKIAQTLKKAKVFKVDSVSAFNTDLIQGSIVLTDSYYPGDKGVGSGKYLIVDRNTTSFKIDEIINHSIGADKAAILLVEKGVINAQQAGIKGDWNGGTGTDETARLQACIDYFEFSNQSSKYGIVDITGLNIRCDSAKIDFRLVSIRGGSKPIAGFTSGSTIYIGANGGLFSSNNTNTGVEHSNFKIESSSQRTDNGQVCLDLSGHNYPRLRNIQIFGGAVGLRLNYRNTVECHYGAFYNVDLSRCWKGLQVLGGNKTQSHSFFGGRFWDCVQAYVNEEGTSDINFFGISFESDIRCVHVNAGDNPEAAQSKFFGCRDECDDKSDVSVGSIIDVGTYYSGYDRPTEFDVSGGQTQIRGNTFVFGNPLDQSLIAQNLLRNPQMKPDVGDTTKIPGWQTIPSTIFEVLKASRDNVIKWTRASGFQAFEQYDIPLKKGRYKIGFVINKENSVSNGNILLQLLDSSGQILTQGTDVDVDFNSSKFTQMDGAFLGNTVVEEINILRDIERVRFRGGINNMPVGQIGYFGSPFISSSANTSLFNNSKDRHEDILLGSSPPSTGFYRKGTYITNTDVNELGTTGSKYIIKGWIKSITGANNNTPDWLEDRSLTGN